MTHNNVRVDASNGAERRITAANHGFPDGQDVYHSHPLGRRIGQMVTRQLDWDIALVQPDPSIAFASTRYFEALSAQRLTPVKELLYGDWFEVEGISTGRIDLCARSTSRCCSLIEPNSDPLDAREWKIEVGFSSYGASGAAVIDGGCGAPIFDREGRVAGFSDGRTYRVFLPSRQLRIRWPRLAGVILGYGERVMVIYVLDLLFVAALQSIRTLQT